MLKTRNASLTTSPRHVGTCGHLRPPDQNVDDGSFSTLLAVCCTWSRARLCCGYKANLLIINAHKSCDTIILFSSSSRLCKTRETVDIFVGRRSDRQRDKEERTEKRGRSRASAPNQPYLSTTFRSFSSRKPPILSRISPHGVTNHLLNHCLQEDRLSTCVARNGVFQAGHFRTFLCLYQVCILWVCK